MTDVIKKELLAKYTTFGIGGPADYFIVVRDYGEMIRAVMAAQKKDWPVFVLGGGSNILVSDKGWQGLVIKNQTDQMALKGGQIEAKSGVNLSKLVRAAGKKGLAGLEDFIGIPGSLGGAIYNNAHYNGKFIGDLVESVEIFDKDGHIKILNQEECQFGYDRSRFQATGEIILKVKLSLRIAKTEGLKQRLDRVLAERKDKYPVGRSAGCIFKNPKNGLPAGQLIDQAGLKGESVGDAQVSSRHANFIINKGKASAQDVLKLIALIKTKVAKKFKINLEEEIIFVGEK